MPKADQLAEINARWIRDCTCSLRETATQAVPGNGNPDADIVFIGEAPGKAEDVAGKPFVGSAGKFLNEMFAEIKLKREDVYITNIVKYRPPNNRDPLPTEIAACSLWLSEELRTIEPKLIVFLGRHALNRFFPKAKIGEVHGKILQLDINGIPTKNFLPLYHPAAALYNGSLRSVLVEDFKKIPQILKEIEG